jgi:serine/threonine protein phosphatase PrpC
MTVDNPHLRVWFKSLPSREHPQRNEDQYWSAANGLAHAVIDGMGGGRRIVNGREIGGEHAAAELRAVLAERLENLPPDLALADARRLLAAVVAEAGERIYRKINFSGQITPDQVPAGSSAAEISAAAVMTAAILCEGGRRAVISQNGDTRAYLYSNGVRADRR